MLPLLSDALWPLSTAYAMGKAIDKATLLAGTILTNEWMLHSR